LAWQKKAELTHTSSTAAFQSHMDWLVDCPMTLGAKLMLNLSMSILMFPILTGKAHQNQGCIEGYTQVYAVYQPLVFF